MSEIKRKRRFKTWQVLTSGGFLLLLMIQNVPFEVPINHIQRDDLKLYSMLLDDDIVWTKTMPQYTKIRPEHLKELQHHLVDFNYTQMYPVNIYNYRPHKP